ncbi:Uncharacterised protein [Legionella pneumophila]|uniref:Dot/Icm T4SS effector RavN n=1 Tax=Legionella pneumophila TaxID=446 RepID=UPI00026D995F|nr:Dot/Icm T4SS effector RavN [Legionella pneumophila]CCD08422.1 conserved protein of unknown function [Legionella pneumophila subsp. pneumophila]CZJ96382.1 Uncharacterised protein [Legionella pneumophila]CZR11381.1 Uncharacterised protein [Legionella pneumophila]HAT3871748.1 Dot/Icm T4SS effector RavN [Legionella pneumophila]HAT9354875.1 Dot/Icm T4SS effector RavN [Legionella pneumophila subsp. pneumophila]
MPTYFDPIMQEDTVLDENTIVYLVKIGDNKFSIKAISSGLEHLPSDPTTHAEKYWPIPAKSLIDHSSNKLLFEEDKLTNQPISKDQVIELFAVDPDKTEPKQFSDSVKRELTENWAREVLQDQFAHAGQNPHFFFYQPLFIHGHHGDNPAQQQDNAMPIPLPLLMFSLIPPMNNNNQQQMTLLFFNVLLVPQDQGHEPEQENEGEHAPSNGH